MPTSAAMLMYRVRDELEVLLAHPGGPLWENRDEGAWSIPKGEVEPGEDMLSAARREFAEETCQVAEPPYIELGHITQRGGKIVHAWAFRGDCDLSTIRSNTFKMEWPRGSGHTGTLKSTAPSSSTWATRCSRSMWPKASFSRGSPPISVLESCAAARYNTLWTRRG